MSFPSNFVNLQIWVMFEIAILKYKELGFQSVEMICQFCNA